MTAPRVSIGMPVFNGEAYLEEALESLVKQTYHDFELIISDNCSTDGTQDICSKFAAGDSRIRYVRQDTNRGAGWNHNYVVDAARGELFKLACYDDICAPRLVEACVALLDRHPEAVLAYSKTDMMRGDMRELDEYRTDMELDSSSTAIRFGDLIDEAPPSFPIFGVIRSRALRRTTLFGSYKASDRVVLVRLALMGRFVQIPEILFFYRWHNDNATHLVKEPHAFYRWWDPKTGSGRIFPETRLLYEYVKSLFMFPLTAQERWQCAREIWWWFQAQRRVIFAELKGLFRPGVTIAQNPTTMADRLARRARRRRIKESVYP